MTAPQAATDGQMPTDKAGMGVIGRILLAGVFAVGLFVGYSSGLGLLLYIPFAGVGAFLALRRPRMPIGWMLFSVGWGFALISSRFDVSLAQFETGTVELKDKAFIVAQSFGYLAAFVLLPAIVMVFPSGRLPAGTWGRVLRLVIGVEAMVFGLVAFSPQLNVNLKSQELSVLVRNPVAILPDLPIWTVVGANSGFLVVISMAVAATSIAVRFRRAVGVERQQLKWLAGAFTMVVLGVIFGLTVATIAPRTAESGVVWFPAIAGFVAVPISIAVAILRYRLYEINTIINRAIVYGLLTAILTGGSAAVIALGQRLFVGVIGAGSDATIVLTTLLVVTAFNPIKARLQAIVDRRFKDNHGPEAALQAFVTEARHALTPPDLHRSLARLLEIAVEAYRSKGGKVEATGARRTPWHFTTGEAGTGPSLVALATAGPVAVRLEIGRSDEFVNADALQEALEAIVAEAAGVAAGVAAASPASAVS